MNDWIRITQGPWIFREKTEIFRSFRVVHIQNLGLDTKGGSCTAAINYAIPLPPAA
jgi:hypothetical protein